MIRSSLLAAAFTFAAFTAAAQSNIKNWHSFENKVSVDEVIADRNRIGLPENTSLQLIRIDEDKIGMRHHRYQQSINGVPVDGAIFIVHELDGQVVSANGKLVQNINEDQVSLHPNDATLKALEFVKAEKYAWESPAAEDMKRRVENDPAATYYPKGELAYYDPEYSQNGSNYRLCYKIDVYALSPLSRSNIFVDAQTGEVLGEVSLIHTGTSNGTAVTRYSDTQSVVTDSIAPSYYRLRDYSRGSGIETYNMRTNDASFIPDSAVDFVDFDNFWDNANAEKDEVGGDVHWGSEMTFDYFLTEHNRYSYDDNGKLVVSYVHVDDNWFNARFVGDWMEYGDGSGNPLTSIDVVSHEMTHGVVGTTAGLIYSYESGALNESFCDIFGTAVEHYALPDTSSDWLIGKVNFTLRSMSNPNAYGHPDTYKGTSWHTGPSDNGGVHTNSGVQNYWFYLLSEGGSGTNDKGQPFSVTGIGMDSAADVSYRSLAYYLTPTSGYLDARQGAIQAAEDLYGQCSWEVMEVARAWQAVGVGSDTLTRDFAVTAVTSPNTGCGLTSSEQVTIDLVYYRSGCGDYVEPGESIPVYYSVDGGIPVQETILLVDTLWGGDTIPVTFGQTADLSAGGTYDIKAWVDFVDDDQTLNDTADVVSIINPFQISNSGITFETQPEVLDSFYTVTTRRSFVNITPLASNLSANGLRMTGSNPRWDRNFVVPPTQGDIWTQNPDYLAQTCLCVDATGWNTAYLKFDLKQTFSKWYNQEYGFDLPLLASTMRISVDGTPVTGDYHPVTYWSDPYFSRTIDLSAYAGTQFTVCFETMNFIKQEDDPVFGSKGDNAYLDNIWVGEDYVSSVGEEEGLSFEFYPNPSTGQVLVSAGKGAFSVRVFDVAGRVVLEHRSDLSSTEINLSQLQSGSYYIQVFTADQESEVEQIILH